MKKFTVIMEKEINEQIEIENLKSHKSQINLIKNNGTLVD